MSFFSVIRFVASAVFGSIVKFNEYITDVGMNLTIPCLSKGSKIWIREECNTTKEFQVVKFIIFYEVNIKIIVLIYVRSQQGTYLEIQNVQHDDAGTYICLSTLIDDDDERAFETNEASAFNVDYFPVLTIILRVRSAPGPVSSLVVRLSTVLGVIMWQFPKNHSGGYPLKSFTAQFRPYFDDTSDNETIWETLDPENIPANVV